MFVVLHCLYEGHLASVDLASIEAPWILEMTETNIVSTLQNFANTEKICSTLLLQSLGAADGECETVLYVALMTMYI